MYTLAGVGDCGIFRFKCVFFRAQVIKDNIEIRFFDEYSDWKVILRGKTVPEEVRVTNQRAMSFEIPPYKDQHINRNVEVISDLI